MGAPSSPPFRPGAHRQLFNELEKAALDVFRASAAAHAGEDFYSVAFYTSGEYSYVADSVSTTEGLARVAGEYLEEPRYRDEWGTLEAAMAALKWSPCDSPYHGELDGRFAPVDEILETVWRVAGDSDAECLAIRKTIHETFMAALAVVRDAGIFDRDRVVFNLLMGDQSDEERLLNAEVVNAAPVVVRFRSELAVDADLLERLRRDRWQW